MYRILATAAAVVALASCWLAASAHAQAPYSNAGRTELTNVDGTPVGDGKLQAWVDSSTLPTVPGQFSVALSPWPQYRPGTMDGTPIYYVATDPFTRQGILHELAHKLDYSLDADPVRAGEIRGAAMQILGRTGAWRQAGGNSPHEQFAEATAIADEYVAVPAGGILANDPYGVGYGVSLGPKRLAAWRLMITMVEGNATGSAIVTAVQAAL